MESKTRLKDLVYSELSYKIVGILFSVFKELVSGYQEKYYQRAIATVFQKENISFHEQILVPLLFQEKIVGRYILDFLIEDKIVLEIKKGDYFKKENLDQVIGYLKAKNLKLGLIANFTRNGVKTKRILNI